MGKRKISIRTEFTILIVSFTLIIGALVTTISINTFSKSAERSKIAELKQTVEFIKGSVDFDSIDRSQLETYANSSLKRITVVSIDGDVIFESDMNLHDLENHKNRKEIKDAISKGYGTDVRTSQSTSTPLLYYAELVNSDTILRLSSPLSEIKEWRRDFITSFVIPLAVILLLMLLISFYVINSLTRPLSKIIKNTEEYKKGNLTKKLSINNPKEFAELSSILNDMSSSLDRTIKRLRGLENVRKDFVANVSHELKTPLTAIEGFSELLLNTDTSIDEQKQYLNIVYKNAIQMENIVKDLLLLSQLESDTFTLKKDETTLNHILTEVRNNIEYKLNEKHDELVIAVNDGVSNTISVNEHLIIQALTNLVVNAIIYSGENNTVEIAVSENNGQVEFAIKDNGIGIPKGEERRIFERFYRVDKARSRSSGGTGLGLSIVKHIATIHGGNISVKQNENGVGSTFTLSVPE